MHSGIALRFQRSAVPFALSSLALALIVAIGYGFHLNTATVVLLCLFLTVLHALADGFISSAIVSSMAGACLIYFFLPPLFSFRIDNPLNVLAFFAFLIIANGVAWLVSKAYEALRDNQQQLALAESAAHLGLWSYDLRAKSFVCSKEYLRLFGLRPDDSPLSWQGWLERVHPDDREWLERLIWQSQEQMHSWDAEFRVVWPDGSAHWLLGKGTVFLDDFGRRIRLTGVNLDVTERKHTEAALKRASEEALFHQKLESMGRLAGGIAHDFNNLLGGILASAELALEKRADISHVAEELQRIQLASIRGAEIVRQLMIFGGQESSAFEPIDASLLVREMLELLKVSISKHAILHAELAKDLSAVRANPAQLRQVVMNLVTNASEAIGEREGVIRVAAEQVRFGPHLDQAGAPAPPEGEYLQIEISDTGSGMTAEVQARIFDPFFSTKFAGRGLGLAVTQGIVRGHGGSINVVSKPGQGTIFRVLLPCIKQSVHETPIPISLNKTERPSAPVATILMVEDDEGLRRAATRMLRLRGFTVIEASDGSAAVDAIRSHGDDIDALLLDVTLPGMPSRDVFEEAKRLRPELKVVLTSAYGEEVVNASFSGLRVEYFIRKPYQLDDLERLLREE
jgi:two-component system, cell cycle sensor histidine kinase and response regulator CckA